jgi:glycosyltransferase involved in cell wall biosynthesis
LISGDAHVAASPLRVIHAITPGDHFSPLTGSAIPTVVDGLARAAMINGDPRHSVVVETGTYRPRYDSADVIECASAVAPSKGLRYVDAISGRLGLGRRGVGSYFSPTAAALQGQPPSIVLAHNAPILPWLLRKAHHRVVLYAHNDLLRTYSRFEAGHVLRYADAIVCVSEYLADRTRERLPAEFASRVYAVRNGVDTERFSPRTASESALHGVPVRVVFLGRMIPDKGADVLLRAATGFASDEIEIEIVGSAGFDSESSPSSYERELRVLADGLDASVQFVPFVDRSALPALLHSADVLVVPSRWPDPCPLTLGEGMATGLPVIASRAGGIPEVLGSVGILVEPNDPAELAAAIRRLVDDPGLRARLGREARAHAEAHDWGESWRLLRKVLQTET